MLRPLMIVSGSVEVVFGLSALVAPLAVIGGVGGTGADAPTLALIRLLGAATLGLGLAALIARDHLRAVGGMAVAYGLGLYNVLAAPALIYGAASAGGAGLWSGAVLHAVIAVLFVYAFLARR